MSGINLSALGLHDLMDREWLAVNHVGGYASQSILGINTRKYHGLLVAAMSPPVRRMVILSRVEEFVRVEGSKSAATEALASNEYPGAIFPDGHTRLAAFAAQPFPRWAFQGNGWT